MFLHNYSYRLKCIIRDKETMFWAFLFPIILATLFNLAFSNILGAENFNSINLGIVDNAEYQENIVFKKAIESVSNQSTEESGLFRLKYISKEEADRQLNENELEGYIYFNNGLKLIVKESGLNQTIIKVFLDNFSQSFSTMETIITNSSQAIQLDDTFIKDNYLKDVSVSKSAPNTIVTYFYALIGMACFYGCYLGFKEITALQANLSTQGARVSVAPTHKLKILITSMIAAITVQVFNIFVLLGYLILVLEVDFGSDLGYIALTCFIGSITGVTFGTSITAIIKAGEGLKEGILTGVTMFMSFLAGLMYDGMKYIISRNAPLLAYLNPVNLITDSLYALYYYDTYKHFYINIILLIVFAMVFTLITYLAVRRQKYASI